MIKLIRSLFFKKPGSIKQPTSLQVESLEERQMLSVVSIFAQGSMGDERLEVEVQGQSIATITQLSTTEFQEYQFQVDNSVDADDIRLQFTNSVYDPANGIDRNVIVDRIQINNRIYQTENSAVFSTSTWTSSDGIQSGFGRGEYLHTTGYLQYSNGGFDGLADVTQVVIDAEGFGDVVDFELQVDGQAVKKYSLSPRAGFQSGIFEYVIQEDVSADRIRVAFTNDAVFFDPAFNVNVDRNLKINSVSIDNDFNFPRDSDIFNPAENDVFSTGTWLAEDGVTSGFGRGNFLHANGYFEFTNRPKTEITVDATAIGNNVDRVRFEVQVDGNAVAAFQISPFRTNNFDRVVTFEVDGNVTADQVRIVFTNDLFSAQLDRNLRINSLQIDGQVFSASDPSVFSTGTWRPEDGVVDGFGRGNVLHSNGYFQFA